MTDRQPCRLLRAGMFTLVCASVSAHSHRSSSGDEVPLGALLLGMVLVFGIAWAASNRPQSRGTLIAWMLWSQLALHLIYGYTSSGGGHHQVSTEAAASAPTWTMAAAHVLVAVLSAWWLGAGEARLFAFLRFMAMVAVGLLLVVIGVLPRGRVPASPLPKDERGIGSRGTCLRYVRVLRGPPGTVTV